VELPGREGAKSEKASEQYEVERKMERTLKRE